MAPVTGSAPLSGDQYIAPLANVAYRASASPDASGEVGVPSGLASAPMAAHFPKIAPPRRESASVLGWNGVLKLAAMSRSSPICAYAASPGHSVLPTSRWVKIVGSTGVTPLAKWVKLPPAEVR